MVKAIPEGFHSISANFTFKDSRKAIEFYKKAFNAEILQLMPNLSGQGVMHAALKIGDSVIMMGDEMNGGENCAKSAETIGSSPISLFLYVKDVDAVFNKAVAAGGVSTMPVDDMFWGDRVGQIRDPFGYVWMIGTHIQDLTEDQIKKNAAEFFASMGMPSIQ